MRIFLVTFTMLSLPSILLAAQVDFDSFQNTLKPFTTDGCSMFPDSVGERDWQSCCVQHDVSYWKGGTSVEKNKADEKLKSCVLSVSHASFGALVKLGVEMGGAALLPTSWRWGHGWVVNRGYAPLKKFELDQVEALQPKNLDSLTISKTETVPMRSSITGDYCLDVALFKITEKLNRKQLGYKITNSTSDSFHGRVLRKITLMTEGCDSPHVAEFLLINKDDCTTQTDELFFRGKVRFQKLSLSCFQK